MICRSSEISYIDLRDVDLDFEVVLNEDESIVLLKDHYASWYKHSLYLHTLLLDGYEGDNILSEKDISDRSLFTLPDNIFKATHLTRLDVSKNNLSMLPPDIDKLVNLTHLDCSHNYIWTLPVNISKMENLEYINIDNNPIVNSINKKNIKGFYSTLDDPTLVSEHMCKMIILGNDGIGKSTFAKYIIKQKVTIEHCKNKDIKNVILYVLMV